MIPGARTDHVRRLVAGLLDPVLGAGPSRPG